MEPVVVLTSLLRLLLVGVVYALNASALVKLVSKSASSGACVHVLTSAAVLLAGLLYLSSWAPYLVYSLTDGKWLLLGANRHCLLQHFVTSEISAVLLALLAVRVLYRYLVKVLKRPAPTARAASLATCLAWLGPQLLYDTMTTSMEGSALPQNSATENSYRFLDDVMELPRRGTNSSKGYRVGFMVCLQSLDSGVLSSFAWQYAVVVVPLGALVLFCGFRLLLGSKSHRKDTEQCPVEKQAVQFRPGEIVFTDIASGRSTSACVTPLWSSNESPSSSCSGSCFRDTLVDMALYYNLIWLLLLRPLAVLHALYIQTGTGSNLGSSASYIDIGSHLVLTFSCVFSPFSPRVGLCGKSISRRTEVTTGAQPEMVELHNHHHHLHQLLVDIPDVAKDVAKEQSAQSQVQARDKAAILESSGESFC